MSDKKACPFCGEEILAVAIKCKHCQSTLDQSSTAGSSASSSSASQPPTSYASPQPEVKVKTDYSGLPSYYQEEFKKIYDSNESYKGKFNWSAFLFGPIWALVVGGWLSAAIAFVICIITGGLAGIPYWFVYGFRGNYIFYNAFAKDKQLPV